jgi:hypothetical protein
MFFTTICSNVDDCRTECEISDDTATVAVVYEDHDGWHIETFRDLRSEERKDFDASVAAAKQNLSRYVNRMGGNVPEGSTVGGISLWLMEKDDGSALGMPVCGDDREAERRLKGISPEVERRVRRLAAENRVIEAIRELRTETNCSLQQAKVWLANRC